MSRPLASDLSRIQNNIIGTIVLLFAAGSFAVAGQPTAALVFAAVVLVDAGLLLLIGDAATESLARIGRR